MEHDDAGYRIIAFRRALGLTQEQLARQLGVTFSTVSRWENGHVRPSRLAWSQLRILAEHHGLGDPATVALSRPQDAAHPIGSDSHLRRVSVLEPGADRPPLRIVQE